MTVAADGSTVVEYKYARKQVVVTFYRNTSSGDTTTATQTFTYGVTGQKFTSKGWTKSGSTQVGWTTTASGVYKWSVTSGVSDGWINSNSPSIKLYAVWVVNPTITLTNTPTTAVNGYLTKQVATVKYPTANLTTPNYYIKTTRAGTSNIAVTSSCGTSTNPGTCSTITSTKTLAANTWYKVSGNLTVTYNTTATSTGTIYAYAYDGTAKRTTASKNISKIDPTAPSVPTITYNGGANTCTWKNNYSIKLASTDNVSVSYYQVDWDGDGVSNQDITSNVFVPWNGYHSHNNRFRAVDQAGNVSGWSAAHHIHMDTENPTTPTVTFNSGENSHSWKNNYNMTFKSTDNAGVAKFQVDHNQDGTVDREFTASSNAYTFIPESGYSTCTDRYRAVDAAGNVSAWTGVHHIHQDTTLPTVTVSVSGKTATFTIKDNISAIGYGVNQSSSSQPSYTAISGTTSTSKSWTASAAGTYYVWVKDQAGNVNKASFSIASSAFCSYSAGQTWNFAYTGGVQSFTTPCSGTYKLEVWGAQGGNAMSNLGGKGGYSYGNKTVTSGTALYIVVGGAGLTSTSIDVKNGGYNGGGKSQADGSLANYYCGSGGGATHIATATGVLSSLSSNKGAVLIVAGGGGGANYDDGREDYGGPGGAGGGVNGISASRKGDGNTFTATGGTQSSAGTGGSFGQGGNYSYSIHSGGGGGYYGGGTNVHDNAPAAGGSGYIGGVTGGQTIAGNASMPTHAGTSTMIGNTGDGYARITLVSTN